MPPQPTGSGGDAIIIPPPSGGGSGTVPKGSYLVGSHRIVWKNRWHRTSDPSRKETSCSPVATSKLTTSPTLQLVPPCFSISALLPPERDASGFKTSHWYPTDALPHVAPRRCTQPPMGVSAGASSPP